MRVKLLFQACCYVIFHFFISLGNFKVNLGIFRTQSWEFQKRREAALLITRNIYIFYGLSVISCVVGMMPSACKNSDKLSVAEMEPPFKACISAVEKKARNLEKRKVTILCENDALALYSYLQIAAGPAKSRPIPEKNHDPRRL